MELLPNTRLNLWLKDFFNWKALIMVKLFFLVVNIIYLSIFIPLVVIYIK